MNSGQLTAIIIVAIVMFASIVRSAIGGGGRRRSKRAEAIANESGAENARLRDEVKVLKERLAVLERITVEKENSLAREIESLRDH